MRNKQPKIQFHTNNFSVEDKSVFFPLPFQPHQCVRISRNIHRRRAVICQSWGMTVDYTKRCFGEDSQRKPAVDTRKFYFPSEEGSMQPRPGLLKYSGFPSRSSRPEAGQPSGAQAALRSPGILGFQELISERQTHLQTWNRILEVWAQLHTALYPRVHSANWYKGGFARWMEEDPVSSFSMSLNLSAPPNQPLWLSNSPASQMGFWCLQKKVLLFLLKRVCNSSFCCLKQNTFLQISFAQK